MAMSKEFGIAKGWALAPGQVSVITLVNLELSDISYEYETSLGSTLAAITGGYTGSSISLDANDGPFALNEAGTAIVRAEGDWEAGEYEISLTETFAGAINSPRTTDFTLTIEEEVSLIDTLNFVLPQTGSTPLTIPSLEDVPLGNEVTVTNGADCPVLSYLL